MTWLCLSLGLNLVLFASSTNVWSGLDSPKFELNFFSQMTVDKAIITPNWGLAMLCSFMIGFGDSCFNTQVFSMLGSQFRADSAAAFAIFRFFQSIASATVFFYSVKLTMYFQLLLLGIFCSLGTITFLKVEWMTRAKKNLLITEKSSPWIAEFISYSASQDLYLPKFQKKSLTISVFMVKCCFSVLASVVTTGAFGYVTE